TSRGRARLSNVGNGRRANAIIEEIRLMFRQDGMVLTVLDVNALIGEVLSLMRGDLENRHITIDTALSDRLAPVNADGVTLRQVMVNLITNAPNAMSTGVEPAAAVAARHASHGAVEPADHGRGLRRRSRSEARRPHFRAVLHHQVPRHGHGAV